MLALVVFIETSHRASGSLGRSNAARMATASTIPAAESTALTRRAKGGKSASSIHCAPLARFLAILGLLTQRAWCARSRAEGAEWIGPAHRQPTAQALPLRLDVHR